MAGTRLKPCPFCGGCIRIIERIMKISFVYTKAECMGCQMEFEYNQDFALSKKARVAINDSFETAFNRRVEDDNK